jgi:predicted acetyltransferase
MTAPTVTLEPATRADAELLGNLLELYMHDLSAVFPVIQLKPNGRFGYDRLDLYWSEPDRRWAFLIHCDGRVAGFALVQRGSPMSDDPSALDVAEFFVLRSQRRSGIGRVAAALLWQRMPGRWIVRCSEGNASALPFWRRAVAAASRGAAVEAQRPGTPHPWRVFSFEPA